MKKGLFGLLIMWCSIINAYAQEDTTSVEKRDDYYVGTRTCSQWRSCLAFKIFPLHPFLLLL